MTLSMSGSWDQVGDSRQRSNACTGRWLAIKPTSIKGMDRLSFRDLTRCLVSLNRDNLSTQRHRSQLVRVVSQNDNSGFRLHTLAGLLIREASAAQRLRSSSDLWSNPEDEIPLGSPVALATLSCPSGEPAERDELTGILVSNLNREAFVHQS